jgi:hypothetical protein
MGRYCAGERYKKDLIKIPRTLSRIEQTLGETVLYQGFT